jgi:hypothetical protein
VTLETNSGLLTAQIEVQLNRKNSMIPWRKRPVARLARASVAREAGRTTKRWEEACEKRREEAKASERIAEAEPAAQLQTVHTTQTPPASEAPANAAEFAGHAQKHALATLTELARLVTTASSETVRVSAANSVLDRAYGKPLPGAKAGDGAPQGPIEVRWVDPNFP